jgi:leader peptidase (prepilin peptidase)/N-methyltransferase
MVEVLTATVYAGIAYNVSDIFVALPLALLCSSLLVLSFIDFQHLLLPDAITLPLLWSGLLWNSSGYGIIDVNQAIWGAALGYLSLWLTYWFYLIVRKREGLGYGDFKLSAALGAWLGLECINFIMLIGSLLGVITWWIKRNQSSDRNIPFGPALCGAAFLYIGSQIYSFSAVWHSPQGNLMNIFRSYLIY